MLAEKLHAGDTIGVVGVANSLKHYNRMADFFVAESLLQSKGFHVKRGKYVFEDYYGTAGTKEQKAEDLMAMFMDKEVKMILCMEGGQNCNTCIDLLDYGIIRKNPKIITGYSDITVLLQSIYHKTGLVTFHGPSFVCFGESDRENKYKEFESAFVFKKIGKFLTGDKKTIRPGAARGKLIGTNLGSMMYLLGTPYFPDMTGAILLIESYHTSPNECQRRFAHLKQYGIFDKVAGVIIGYNYDLQKDGEPFPQMEDLLLEYTKEYDFPIMKCNDFGHKMVSSVIPVGVELEMDTAKGTVTILEDFLK